MPLVADRQNTIGVNRQSRAVAIPRKFGVVMPFRYAEIAGPSAGQAKVRRRVLHWPIDMGASSFECSDERLKKVYDFCKYSIWATSFAGVYVDGDRERTPYEADGFAFTPVNAVVNAFHYRNLREMLDLAAALGQAEDAAFHGAEV